MKEYILSLDQGTTSSRAILFDHDGKAISSSQKEFRQIFPQPGWVEHDANDIWTSQVTVARVAIEDSGIKTRQINAIGITNQRETTIIWDRESGEAICNAIVWQDRRTAPYCQQLMDEGWKDKIRAKTGLIIDAYFSATKIRWMLQNIEGAMQKAQEGRLAFGTVDSWLIYNLTNRKKHVTDITNASRTMIYNIHDLCWDDELLDLFEIPKSLLPDVKNCSQIVGQTDKTIFGRSIPISGIAGDQQAALFGQLCLEEGMAKNTYGTGCFLVKNTGEKAVISENNLLTTIAWKIGDTINYALEGSIFIAGAAVQWLRDGLNIIDHSAEIEKLAESVDDNGGIIFVPALTGLGAPHWNPNARGTICGITRGTTRGHIARATLESIAYQSYEVAKAMMADSGIQIKELRVDGGASSNNLLMQFQADVLNASVVRPQNLETTALGAAFFAGLATGFWKNTGELSDIWKIDKTFSQNMQDHDRSKLLNRWSKAVSRAKDWEE